MRRTQAPGRGVTLIELIVVITVVGVLASVGARLVASTAGGGHKTMQRLQLANAGDAAMRRMARELQGALPNSVRITNADGSVFIEFVPVADAGRMRRSADEAGNGDPLNLDDANDTSFDVLGPPVAATGAVQLVIQNLGNDVADAYTGNNRRAGVTLGNSGASVSFSAAGAFPDATSSSRFFLVGTPVTFRCTPGANGTGTITRLAGYGWFSAQPTSFGGGTSALLLSNVVDCSISYADALANLGMVSLQLSIGDGDTNALLLHQVAVDNTP